MMKLKNILILIILTLTSSTLMGQKTERWNITEKQAKKIVYESLSDSTLHNVIELKPLLTKKVKAIEFAEMILWEIYGKKNIKKQKPYDVFLIDKYWFLKGTLPKGMKGGTFMIIIDSQDYKVIRITHGK